MEPLPPRRPLRRVRTVRPVDPTLDPTDPALRAAERDSQTTKYLLIGLAILVLIIGLVAAFAQNDGKTKKHKPRTHVQPIITTTTTTPTVTNPPVTPTTPATKPNKPTPRPVPTKTTPTKPTPTKTTPTTTTPTKTTPTKTTPTKTTPTATTPTKTTPTTTTTPTKSAFAVMQGNVKNAYVRAAEYQNANPPSGSVTTASSRMQQAINGKDGLQLVAVPAKDNGDGTGDCLNQKATLQDNGPLALCSTGTSFFIVGQANGQAYCKSQVGGREAEGSGPGPTFASYCQG